MTVRPLLMLAVWKPKLWSASTFNSWFVFFHDSFVQTTIFGLWLLSISSSMCKVITFLKLRKKKRRSLHNWVYPGEFKNMYVDGLAWWWWWSQEGSNIIFPYIMRTLMRHTMMYHLLVGNKSLKGSLYLSFYSGSLFEHMT